MRETMTRRHGAGLGRWVLPGLVVASWILAAVGGVALAGAAPGAGAAEEEATAAAKQRAPVAQVAFEMTSSKPFVPVRINGEGPYWLILDTGNNGGWVVSTPVAEALGVKLENPQQARMGAGEGVELTVAEASGLDFSVGGAAMRDQPAVVFPLQHVAAYEGREIHGLIGRTFFERFVVEIDYPRRTLSLYEPEGYRYAGGGEVVKLDTSDGWPVLNSPVALPGGAEADTPLGAPLDARVILDTGVRGAIVFTRPFTEKHRLAKALPGALAATVGGGIGGETKGLVGRLASLGLGPFTLQGPVAVLSQDESGFLATDDFAGIIGGPVLERFKVIFDYPRSRMILEPAESFDAPFHYDMSGLFLTAEPPAFHPFRVQSVVPGSPAAEAGLKEGDLVSAVDGTAAADLSLEEARELLKTQGARRRLTVLRGGETFTVELTLRPLV